MPRPPSGPPFRSSAPAGQPSPFEQAAAANRLQIAIAQHQRGDLDGAAAIYRDILHASPKHFDALQLLATALLQRGDVPAAIAQFDKALRVNPDHVPSLSNQGAALLAASRHAEALRVFDRAIRLAPAYAEAHNNRGEALRGLGRTDEALAAFLRAAQLKPGYADAQANSGAMLTTLGRHADALTMLLPVQQMKPNDPDLWANIAAASWGLKRSQDALTSYRNALALQPTHLRALNNLAALLVDLDQAQEGLDQADAALRVHPNAADLHVTRAKALLKLNRADEAQTAADAALALDADHPSARLMQADLLLERGETAEALPLYDAIARLPAAPANLLIGAFVGRGACLHGLKRFEEALQAFNRAMALGPLSAEAHHLHSNTLFDLGRTADALAALDASLGLAPHRAAAHARRGALLVMLKRFEEALASFDRALALSPDQTNVMSNRGVALFQLDRFEESAAQYQQLREVAPDKPFLAGRLWHVRLRTCDWTENTELQHEIHRGLQDNREVILPFHALQLSDPDAQQRATKIWSSAQYNVEADALPAQPASGRPLRVGYFSADFRNHAVMALMAGVFEGHDRSLIEPLAFAFGSPVRDAMRARAEAAFGRVTDIGALPESDALRLARDAQLDIAVDLTGHTQDGRPGLFARRVAPVQINYLGFTGSMAMPAYDYLIADETCIPAEARQHYSEKIVWLPDSYQPNDRRRPSPEPRLTRQQCGLPEDAFVFCCFNNSYKIAPDVFALWVEILRRAPSSVLWLFIDNAPAEANLRAAFAASGLAPERLVIARRTPMLEDHLSRYLHADLFLDTSPYNAHTTASDALWCGVPVLTRIGDTFAARVAASLLKAAGLSELITRTPEAYTDLAVALAADRARHAELKQRLIAGRDTCPLFDTARFTRNLEAAFLALHARAEQGLPPEHFERIG